MANTFDHTPPQPRDGIQYTHHTWYQGKDETEVRNKYWQFSQWMVSGRMGKAFYLQLSGLRSGGEVNNFARKHLLVLEAEDALDEKATAIANIRKTQESLEHFNQQRLRSLAKGFGENAWSVTEKFGEGRRAKNIPVVKEFMESLSTTYDNYDMGKEQIIEIALRPFGDTATQINTMIVIDPTEQNGVAEETLKGIMSTAIETQLGVKIVGVERNTWEIGKMWTVTLDFTTVSENQKPVHADSTGVETVLTRVPKVDVDVFWADSTEQADIFEIYHLEQVRN